MFLIGAFFSLYALWEGGLWGVFALHTAWNWMQGNVFGLSVSGAGTAGGALIDLRTSGETVLSGGSFGPEGGALGTAVAFGGILVMLALLRSGRPLHDSQPHVDSGREEP